MRASAKTRKRVRFGPVTYVSPPRPEDTQDADLHDRCGGGLVCAAAGEGHGGGLRRTESATLLLCSTASAERGVSPVTVDVEDDEQRRTPVAPQPPCPGDEMPSDEATYDTPLVCATSAEWCGGGVPPSPPQRDVAQPSGASPVSYGGSPTLSQLLAAVDDVLGGGESQRTARSPVPALLSVDADARASGSPTPPPPSPQTPAPALPPTPACTATKTPSLSERAPAARCDRFPSPPAHVATPAAVTADEAHAAAPVEAKAAACVFCGAGGDTAGSLPASPLCTTHGVQFHMTCALLCPEVYYDVERGALQGVEVAAARARGIKCALCRRPGAAVGCACATCPLSFHVPCAVRAHASIDVEAFLLYCPAHRPRRGGSD